MRESESIRKLLEGFEISQGEYEQSHADIVDAIVHLISSEMDEYPNDDPDAVASTVLEEITMEVQRRIRGS